MKLDKLEKRVRRLEIFDLWNTFNILGILLIVLLLLLFPNKAKADHNDVVHFAAHAGTAYAGTTICYGIGKSVLGKELNPFTIPACGVLTMLAGMAYDSSEPEKRPSTVRNVVGVGAAIGTILVFDF